MLLTINPTKPNRLRINISEKGKEINLGATNQLISIEKKPEVAYGFRYSYYNDQGQISSIQLDFGDFYRTLVIEGPDPNQVDAVFAMLKEQIEKRQMVINNTSLRIILEIIMMASIVPLLIFGIFHYISIKKYIMKGILFIIFGVAIFILYIYMPSNKWFPGFIIHSGEVSWIARYATHLTLIGLILTIILFFVAPYYNKFLKK